MGQKARLVGDVDRVAAQLTPPGVGGPDDYTMGPHCLPQPFLALHALHKIFRSNDKFEEEIIVVHYDQIQKVQMSE